MKKVVVSACLVGVKCRYNGLDCGDRRLISKFAEREFIPICPEQIGGLPTPRPPVEIIGGAGEEVLDGSARVVTAGGEDRTEMFIQGAYRALKIAREHGATQAVFKSKSPSCGCGQIYDGSFTGRLTDGDGVTAALLRRHGLEVVTEEVD